ncbi:diaminopimelate decarboxylase [Candidatus Gracilibacteria bacterium]|nr:diaminopimelate decarboxylase [Candidatus Gracilibacteria bacterium]
MSKYGSPLVLTDGNIIRERCRMLKKNFPGISFHYAVKANYNPYLVKIIIDEGFGLDGVSPKEVLLGVKVGISPEKIVYNENNMTDKDMIESVELGVNLTIGSISRLEKFCRKFPGKSIGIRINGDIAAACHKTNLTAGPDSKFGIQFTEIETALEMAKKYQVKITTAHQHIGSGWLDTTPFLEAMDILFREVKKMPDVQKIDFGGGFGVPYKLDQNHLDYEKLSEQIFAKIASFEKEVGRKFEYAFEPGRFLVCESSVLLMTVNTRKTGSDGKIFIGTDSGFNHLVRPAMYGSYHEILNLSHPNEPAETVEICGNLCESADFFAHDRLIPTISEGDILGILNFGAYGLAQSSPYNLRGMPAEVLIDGKIEKLIRRRETFEDLMHNFDYPFALGTL